MFRCEDFPCCGHYDEGGDARGIPYCPPPEEFRQQRKTELVGSRAISLTQQEYDDLQQQWETKSNILPGTYPCGHDIDEGCDCDFQDPDYDLDDQGEPW